MVEVPEHVAHSVRRLLNQQDDMAFHGTESVQTCEVSTLRLSIFASDSSLLCVPVGTAAATISMSCNSRNVRICCC